MRTKTLILISALTTLVLASSPLPAEVSSEEASQLGKTLTPLGAEMAGNAAGTIPAWTGGIAKPAPGYRQGGHYPDP